MRSIQAVQELTEKIAFYKRQGLAIGLVPTMGYLHSGHLSLVEACKKSCDVCIVSIYVNPSQFNQVSDFDSYPKDVERDFRLLKSIGCDLVWVPEVKDVESIPLNLIYDVENLDVDLEGKYRKGHFKGVLEVVYRLFKAVKPDKAYFGEKDFQQFKIIELMVKKNALPIEVIPSPTMREQDGLAMSSRNVRLSDEQRALAPQLYKTMSSVVKNAKLENVPRLIEQAREALNHKGFSVEYLDIYSFDSQNSRLFAAVKLGEVRLIDNISL